MHSGKIEAEVGLFRECQRLENAALVVHGKRAGLLRLEAKCPSWRWSQTNSGNTTLALPAIIVTGTVIFRPKSRL